MIQERREKILYRILSGKIKYQNDNLLLFIGQPNPLQQAEAEEIYDEALLEAEFTDLITDQEMLDHLQDIGIWSIEDQEFIDGMPSRVEELKVELYQAYSSFRGKRVEQLRKSLNKLITHGAELFKKRHSYDMYTCEGFAFNCKLQYMICCATTDINGKFVDVSTNGHLLQILVQHFLTSKLNEKQIRDLVKNEPWRMMWAASRGINIFDVPAVSLTIEQKQLLAWSKLYDNIRESPECPDEVVFKDDDLLDGWLILQSRKQSEKKKQKHQLSEKMSKANEVFIPAETAEDAKRIDQLNDAGSRMLKRQRLQTVSKQGVVAEQNFQDSQLKMQQQALAQIRNRARKK